MKENFVKYQDLINITDVDKRTKNQKFVVIPTSSKKVIGRYVTDLNEKEYSPVIKVRKQVLNRLNKADSYLKEFNSNYQLMVVYGYRSMEKQVKFFNRELNKYKKSFKDKLELYEFVHEKIAVPEVSGHPTGGAVDIVIYDMSKDKIIDFGTEVHDFNDCKSYIYYPNITGHEQNNRLLLREVMMKAGFAPYDGEWWHFSYGDKEWAFYYKRNKFLYPQVNKEDVY